VCHHIGDIPEWDGEASKGADEEELPEFLSEEASDDLTVLTDGGEEE
jgi:hypothetical protein